MFNIGESVVNSESLQTGNVVRIDEENNKILVEFVGGGTQWIPAENVKKLLIETDPTTLNSDDWQNLNG